MRSTSILLCDYEEIKVFDSIYEKYCLNFLVIKVTIASEKVLSTACSTTLLVLAPRNILINLKILAKMVSSKKRKNHSHGRL